MNEHLAERALAIVEDALELTGEKRAAFVARECGDDAELRSEVESLLDHETGVEIPAAGEEAPSLDSLLDLPRSTRYELREEVARGAMGAIVRARDSVLDREVAVKVLLDEHHANPEMLGRFISEAHLGAQLQHPGVAPVYDLGTLPDGRPFFALKLVRGETFSARLGRRSKPSDDQQRLLTIFEQICQTMAYAQARGVIHRDLKPDNIMVGEFGEVQVMDWGLAKLTGERRDSDVLLPESETSSGEPKEIASSPVQTRVGVVMGTPAYMPPEQAAGRAGTTTDVFALGAILCEILTGLPPYTGETPVDVVAKSVDGDVRDGMARLEECGADRDLVELARRCLSPDPEGRPESAWEVGRAVREHLKAVEQRLREAEIESVRAHAVAAEERKRRRVSLALGACVLIVAVVGLGSWLWIGRVRERQAESLAELRSEQLAAAEAQAYRANLRTGFRELEYQRWREVGTALERAKPQLRNWEWHYLSRQLDQSVATYPRSLDCVFAGFVRGEDMVLAVNRQGVAKRWERSTSRELGSHDGYGPPVAIGPDGRLVLAAGNPPILWNAITGEVVARFNEAPPSPRNRWSAISPGGSHVAISSTGRKNVFLLETATGRLLKKLPSEAPLARFSSDGEWLLWRRMDRKSVGFWAVNADREARPSVVFPRSITGAFALTSDRSWLAASTTSSIFLWNLETDSRRELELPYSLQQWGPQLVFDEGGARLISVGFHDAVRIWEPRSGSLLRTIPANFGSPGHLGDASIDSGQLLTASDERVKRDVRVWDLGDEDPRVLRGHTSYVYPVAASLSKELPGRDLVASGAWDRTVRLWDARTGGELAVLKGHRREINDLAFDPTARRLFSGSTDRTVRVWSTATGALLEELKFNAGIERLELSPDGTQLLVVARDVSVLDGRTLKPRTKLPLERPLRLAFSPSGETFAVTSWKPWKVTTWDARTLAPLSSFDISGNGTAVTYSPSGTHVAVGNAQGTITVLDVANPGANPLKLTGHAEEVFALAYLPDGSRLFSGGRDATIRIWDPDSGDELATLRDHSDYVYSLAFSLDGQRLVSGSGDKTVRLWETTPLSERFAAIQEAARLRPQATTLIDQLSTGEGDTDAVAARLRADSALPDGLRREAFRELLRRSAAVDRAPH